MNKNIFSKWLGSKYQAIAWRKRNRQVHKSPIQKSTYFVGLFEEGSGNSQGLPYLGIR